MKKIHYFSYFIIVFITLILFCSSCYSSTLKKDSCGSGNLVIYFTEYKDYRITCCGYNYVRDFFIDRGYSVNVPITIHFEPSISLDGFDTGYDKEDIYGYSNPKTMNIHIRTVTSPLISNQEREYFRKKYNKQDWILSNLVLELFHKSVVIHEIAHLYAHHNFIQLSSEKHDSSTVMGIGVQEYIASVAQLTFLWDKELLYCIEKQYEPNIRFDYEEQINSVLFSISPQEFAIASIRHFQSMSESEQKKFLDRILSGELNPDFNFGFGFYERTYPYFCSYLK